MDPPQARSLQGALNQLSVAPWQTSHRTTMAKVASNVGTKSLQRTPVLELQNAIATLLLCHPLIFTLVNPASDICTMCTSKVPKEWEQGTKLLTHHLNAICTTCQPKCLVNGSQEQQLSLVGHLVHGVVKRTGPSSLNSACRYTTQFPPVVPCLCMVRGLR